MVQSPRAGSAAAQALERRRTHRQKFDRWVTAFRQSDRGRDAINALYQITEQAPERHQELEEAIFLACFNASEFKNQGDADFRAFAEALDTFKDSLPKQRKAVNQLTVSVRANPQLIDIIFRKGRATQQGTNSLTPEAREQLLALLSVYARGLSGFESVVKNLRDDFSSPEGCLHFSQTRRRKMNRQSGAINGLLFELTLLIRKWTLGEPLILRDKSRMPSSKLPNSSYGIVAAFASATFPEMSSVKGNTARSRLKKLLLDHPGISYFPWSR